MCWNGLWSLNVVEVTKPLTKDHLIWTLHHLVRPTQELVWKSEFKVITGLDFIDVFLSKMDSKCFDIALEVGYLSSTNDWKCVRRCETI